MIDLSTICLISIFSVRDIRLTVVTISLNVEFIVYLLQKNLLNNVLSLYENFKKYFCNTDHDVNPCAKDPM